ncbi:hypothetical protein FPOAC1_002152 [Fusarium poae]|uniref:hypothetical protein n=1 Tax=Fusarium poae TaxID=36050 RepID=UPI001CE9405D|nr:hypothetical protein FPOAC1_002152 [Fusarium poae]KAG8676154.1 hypothetical protein FPOAC1_002152 [Fusarium poae]
MRENHLDPRSPGFDSLYRSFLLLSFLPYQTLGVCKRDALRCILTKTITAVSLLDETSPELPDACSCIYSIESFPLLFCGRAGEQKELTPVQGIEPWAPRY